MPVSDPATVEGVTERRVPRRRLRFAIALLVAVAGLVALAGPASAATKIAFVQGEQNVTVDPAGRRPQRRRVGAARGADPGRAPHPDPQLHPPRHAGAEREPDRHGRDVDLGARFVQGTASDTLLARLAQVVTTVTAVPGVTSVQVLIKGGVPLGLFPGIDATVPAHDARPSRPPTCAPAARAGAPRQRPGLGPKRGAQERLAALGYLLPDGVDGQPGPATTTAVIAFQKWQGLPRDGVARPGDPRGALRTATPARRPITQGGSGRARSRC